MKDFSKLLQGVICKKNRGYRYHRMCVDEKTWPTGNVLFQKSLPISKSDIEIATNILPILKVNTIEDMFLGLTCVTMLSSYEKRQKYIAKVNGNKAKECVFDTNNYFYKGYVRKIITEGLKNNLNFTFCVKKDDKDIPVTYITLGGIQFSFHSGDTEILAEVAKNNSMPQYKEQEWNKNFSMQNGAKEVFEYALHLKNTSKLAYINETPKEYAYSLREQARNK